MVERGLEPLRILAAGVVEPVLLVVLQHPLLQVMEAWESLHPFQAHR